MTKIDIYNVEHPSRQKAIKIMEYIAEALGEPEIFDCTKDNPLWYNIEDELTSIINSK